MHFVPRLAPYCSRIGPASGPTWGLASAPTRPRSISTLTQTNVYLHAYIQTLDQHGSDVDICMYLFIYVQQQKRKPRWLWCGFWMAPDAASVYPRWVKVAHYGAHLWPIKGPFFKSADPLGHWRVDPINIIIKLNIITYKYNL
jgi:hypothetical protein